MLLSLRRVLAVWTLACLGGCYRYRLWRNSLTAWFVFLHRTRLVEERATTPAIFLATSAGLFFTGDANAGLSNASTVWLHAIWRDDGADDAFSLPSQASVALLALSFWFAVNG